MGFSKIVSSTEPSAATLPLTLADMPRTAQGTEDKKVRGQVAMHAIVVGYEAASRLVLTLAPKPDEARSLLHTLAAEIAKNVEEYSFRV